MKTRSLVGEIEGPSKGKEATGGDNGRHNQRLSEAIFRENVGRDKLWHKEEGD